MKKSFKIKFGRRLFKYFFFGCVVLVGLILIFGNSSSAITETPVLKTENRTPEKTKNSEIDIDLKPEPRFIIPFSEKINEKKEIKIELKNVIGVEFYLRRPESLVLNYLSQGIKEKENIWKFSFDSQTIPNGSYFLVLKIENQYGSYEKEMAIEIKNELEKDILKEEQLKKEITEKEKKIETEKKEMEAKTEEIKTTVLEEVKKSTEKMMENLFQSEKEGFGKEIEVIELEIKKKVSEKIEEWSENKKEEIKKENQLQEKEKEEKEIIEKIEPIVQEIKEIAKKKPQREFQEPLTLFKQDKEKKLNQQKNLQKEIQEKTISISQELEKIKKEKEEIKGELKKEIIKPIQFLGEKKIEIKEKIEKEIENLQLKAEEKLEELEKTISQKEKIRQKILIETLKDSDGDGVSDEEELRRGINPFLADSDNDGFLDGIELEQGFDPLNPSLTDKITYEEPKKSKAPISENYKIEKLEIIELPTEKSGLKIQGRGTPNTFITIYLYSEPFLVLITKTDANGNFVYILDKSLDKGAHQVYIAVVDNKGKIRERSEVFNFIQTETAVAAILPPSIPQEAISPAESLYRVYTIFIASLVIFSLGLALFVIGILTRRERKIP